MLNRHDAAARTRPGRATDSQEIDRTLLEIRSSQAAAMTRRSTCESRDVTSGAATILE